MKNFPDTHFAVAALISLGNSSGSGFFYKTVNKAYLVTAKHVLFNDANILRAEEIEIVTQTKESYDESVFRYRIDLQIAQTFVHNVCDVAVIIIADTSVKNGELNYVAGVERIEKGFSRGVLASRENIELLNEVLVSNDVFVSGYPTSLGTNNYKQFDINKPLLRKGIVANIYRESNTIVLDCPVYGGNSGGPVMQPFYDGDNKIHYKIIGVVSQFIPFVQRWRNDRDRIDHIEYLNSGYSVATSMDMVLEIIDKIEN